MASAVLFANGDYSSTKAAFSKIGLSDFLVAVDGGLIALLRSGRKPNLLIGDLDSVSSKHIAALQQSGIPILRFPIKKDETDLELALMETASRDFEKITILGGLGKRIDQTLGNISLLKLPCLQRRDVRLVDDRCEIFLVQDFRTISGSPEEMISLLPLFGTTKGITTSGLEYPLKNDMLRMDKTRGISNRMTAAKAEIHVRSGVLLCIHYFQTDK